MAFFKRKRYNIFVKLIAIALFLLALIMVWGTFLILEDSENLSVYDSYYDWDIVGHTVEKLDDGKCKVTFDIKNRSAYNAYIDKYSIKLEYGSTYYIDNLNLPYPDGYLYESLNDVIVPAGETIKYSITFALPEGLRSLRAVYYGESYKLSEARESDRSYRTYEVNLK